MPDLLLRVRRWVLWTRRRAAWTAVAACLVLAVCVRAGAGLATSSHTSTQGRAAAAAATHRARAAQPAPPSAPASPSATPTPAATASPAASPAVQQIQAAAAPPAAVLAADNFAAAWVSRGPYWLTGVSQYATRKLAAQLAQTDPAANPATRINGPAVVTGRAGRVVHLSVPTDAGPVLIDVTDTGAGWLATSVVLQRTGN